MVERLATNVLGKVEKEEKRKNPHTQKEEKEERSIGTKKRKKSVDSKASLS